MSTANPEPLVGYELSFGHFISIEASCKHCVGGNPFPPFGLSATFATVAVPFLSFLLSLVPPAIGQQLITDMHTGRPTEDGNGKTRL